MTVPDAAPAITCPTTGRVFPAVKRMDLHTCTRCGGFIDIRVEAWESGPGLTRHLLCPGREVGT